MTVGRVIGLVSVTLVGIGIAAAGCSSSTGSAPVTPPPVDSGVHHDATAQDTGTKPVSNDASLDASDSGGTCPPASTASFTAATYVPSVAHQGVCGANDISAFITACGYGQAATQTTCATWQSANVIADAGATCGNCIMAPNNNGGIWLDPEAGGMAYNGQPNYAGCIQLTDSAHGAACASALNNITACEGVACDNNCAASMDPNAYPSCAAAADMGSCSTYATASQTACATDFADGGASDSCSPGTAAGDTDVDLAYIITLICGGGTGDSGAPGDANEQ